MKHQVFVVANDGSERFYLLKLVRSGFDVYCIPPHLGGHYSIHESGKSHFCWERESAKHGEEPLVILQAGEAGMPKGNGIMATSLKGLGRAVCICTAIYPIDSLSNDFRKFTRSSGDCFDIDTNLFPNGTGLVEIGVWAVPDRNKVSFEFNIQSIPANLLHKTAWCEPQLWIYARPFP